MKSEDAIEVQEKPKVGEADGDQIFHEDGGLLDADAKTKSSLNTSGFSKVKLVTR